MFGIFFGWRKASKCKKLIKRLRCRLNLLKIKRHSMVKQLRQDMAQLIKLGYEETALNRADQLFKDESTLAVYEMLDNFCDFINLNLSYIRKHKDIPNDVNEAASSLIFASARCGDLPELPRLRELFRKRYGLRFAAAAVDLLPGNLVNHEIRKKLSTDKVSDEVKYELVDEIAKDYCLRPEVLSLEYRSESKHQQPENKASKADFQTTSSTNEGTNTHNSDSNSEFISISLSSSSVEQFSPEKLDSPVNSPAIGDSECRQSHKPMSSSESSPYDFHEEMVVYLDDIEELGTSPEDGHCQDQRLFMFKPLSVSSISRKSKAYSNRSRENKLSAKKSTQVYAEYQTYYSTKPIHKHTIGVQGMAAERDAKVEEDYSPSYSSSSSRSEDPVPPYSRTMTMPQQRPINADDLRLRESIPRSISCPIQIQHSSHVHPKLPNYEEIAAKFSALKMECLQSKKPCNDPVNFNVDNSVS